MSPVTPSRLTLSAQVELERERKLLQDLKVSPTAVAKELARVSKSLVTDTLTAPAEVRARAGRLGSQGRGAVVSLGQNLFESRGALDKQLIASVKAMANQAGQHAEEAATLLHALTTARRGAVEQRVELTERLMGGLTADEAGRVIDAYVSAYGRSPEFDIRSDGLGQPLNQLSEADEVSMLLALNRGQMTSDARRLLALSKTPANELTVSDRQDFYRLLPMMGLWDRSTRQQPGGPNLDSAERRALLQVWKDVSQASDPGSDFDAAMTRTRANLAQVAPPPLSTPREKNIALIASPHGAQWQEAMDFAVTMRRAGYAVQIFTPDDPKGPGAMPVGFQRDSLGVSKETTELGLGAPLRLNPRDPEVARLTGEMLGNTRRASDFNRKDFGLVYLAGGLGFNEDVIRAERMSPAEIAALPQTEQAAYLQHLTDPVNLTLDPSIKRLMLDAVGNPKQQPLPFVTLCHGATAFAGLDVPVERGGTLVHESFIKGVKTASLPPFEAGVRLRGSVSKSFETSPVMDTHAALQRAGADVDARLTALENATAMDRVTASTRFLVQDERGNAVPTGRSFAVISGPGPQTAENLARYVLEQESRGAFLRRPTDP